MIARSPAQGIARGAIALALAAFAVGAAGPAGAQQPPASAPAPVQAAPGPNDYGRAESWLCRPGRTDACAVDLTTTSIAPDGKRTVEPWTANPSAAIDCFYVYPTVSRDTMRTSDMVPGPEERNVARLQLARFGSVCRPFAPMYRQVSLRGLNAIFAEGTNLLETIGSTLGYRDIVDAWNGYLARDNGGRGVVLIGHSQGAGILRVLLQREIDGRPIQNRIVSAILLGSPVAVPADRDVGGDLTSMRLCRSAEQVGCVINYATFRSTVPPSATSLFSHARGEGRHAACTNPAALAGGSGALKSHLASDGGAIAAVSPRAVAWDRSGTAVATPFVTLPGLVTAQCVRNEHGSYLQVTVNADSSDARADDIPGDLGAPGRPSRDWGLHLVDVDIAIGNLVDIVSAQARAFARGTRVPPPSTPQVTAATAIPRTASGRPDMNGIWQAMTTANWDIEPHPARAAPAMRPGPVVPVPAKELVALGATIAVPSGMGIVVGGTIPYTAAALAKKKENQADWLNRDPEIKCYLPGVPRAMYMPLPFQILQSEKAFFIAFEYAGAMRNIYLKDPGPPQVDTWMGQSVGRWDGDSFVVESSGFNDQSWFDRAGNHHSEFMKVTERFTMTSPYHIAYEATMDDAKTFTRPWSIRLTLYKNVEPGARLGQFKCTEFVEELLYGHLRKP